MVVSCVCVFGNLLCAALLIYGDFTAVAGHLDVSEWHTSGLVIDYWPF